MTALGYLITKTAVFRQLHTPMQAAYKTLSILELDREKLQSIVQASQVLESQTLSDLILIKEDFGTGKALT